MTNATVDKILSLKSELESLRAFQKRFNCGFQGAGVHIQGNKSAIAKVEEWLNAYDNQKVFREEIKRLREELAEIKEALG